MSNDVIHIQSARVHNLKNVSLELPKNKLIVLTGVSGSGKSSLAFHTLHAESYRRFVNSLSSYARQFLDAYDKPDVDDITGLSPSIAIEQKTVSNNPRSTVGTLTEVLDYIRLLYASIGKVYSPATGALIEQQTIDQMVDRLLEIPLKTKFMLIAPVIRERKGEFSKLIKDIEKQGFTRIQLNGEFMDIADFPKLDKNKKHSLGIVVDRIVMNENMRQRLSDSLETTLKQGEGMAVIHFMDDKQEWVFSEKYACPVSGFSLPKLEARFFSFNNPFGYCPTCLGLGKKMVYKKEKIVRDDSLSIAKGAISCWSKDKKILPEYEDNIRKLLEQLKYNLNTQWRMIDEHTQQIIFEGSKDFPNYESVFSFLDNLQDDYRGFDATWFYKGFDVCETCKGSRLRWEVNQVKVDGMTLPQVMDESVGVVCQWFEQLPERLSKQDRAIATSLLKEIKQRLGFLNNIGLNYLTLGREVGSLSGGELQRIRLAAQIGTGLTGITYILDEPSIGLHPFDNQKLIDSLKRLRDIGNTVIVVEHDHDTMLQCDWIVDIGPFAGNQGGEITAQGTPKALMKDPNSLTGKYLTGELDITLPNKRKQDSGFMVITGCRENNLKQVDAKFPLNNLVCVTGLSGSGKSSLILDTLYPALYDAINNTPVSKERNYDSLTLDGKVQRVIFMDQSPIGRTSRSNPITYMGAFTLIRELFAELPTAKAKGYTASRFSFNVKGGRCEACKGDGVVTVEMNFLPSVEVTCEACNGMRYNRETLAIQYRGLSIYDVLNLTIDEALGIFDNITSLKQKLAILQRVGMGYIHLGQSSKTLSGGEAQRIKLAKELSKTLSTQTVYIFDEPTTGLHTHDIKKLVEIFQEIVDKGNTVIVIEHNTDVMKVSDWIVDIGPFAGDKGGEVVTMGSPEQVMRNKVSLTAPFIRTLIDKKLSNKKIEL